MNRGLQVGSGVWLGRALCAETQDAWLQDNRYINLDLPEEQKKAQMKLAG